MKLKNALHSAHKPLVFVVAGLGVLSGGYWVGAVSAEGLPEAQTLFYSGVLEEDGVLINDSRKLNVGLYATDEGGSPECETGSVDTMIEQGHFRVQLPQECVEAVSNDPDLWVQVETNDSVLGRTKIGAVPFAVEAKNAQHLGQRPSGEYVRWDQQTRRVEVAPSDFQVVSGSPNIDLAHAAHTNSMPRWEIVDTGQTVLGANVSLPLGSRPTEVLCHYWDSHDSSHINMDTRLYLNSQSTGERLPNSFCSYKDSDDAAHTRSPLQANFLSVPFRSPDLLTATSNEECYALDELWRTERPQGMIQGDVLGVVVGMESTGGSSADDLRFLGCSVEYEFVAGESF